jgi:hypothetical protein
VTGVCAHVYMHDSARACMRVCVCKHTRVWGGGHFGMCDCAIMRMHVCVRVWEGASGLINKPYMCKASNGMYMIVNF